MEEKKVVASIELSHKVVTVGKLKSPKDVFYTDQSIVYGVFRTNERPLTKVSYTVKWTCVNGYNPKDPEKEQEIFVMPKEYNPTPAEIEKMKLMDAGKEEERDFTIMFDLRNNVQKTNFRPGKYKVEVFIQRKLKKTKDFAIEKRVGLYLGVRMGKTGIEEPLETFDGHVVVIYGMYHFNQLQATNASRVPKSIPPVAPEGTVLGDQQRSGETEIGRIRWVKLHDEDDGEKKKGTEKEIIKEIPVMSKFGQRFDCFKFHLSKPSAEGFEVGRYRCEVVQEENVLQVKEFVIEPPQPRLFLGEVLTKFHDIIDDKSVFAGKVKIIRGVYRFCRNVPSTSSGNVKWILKKAHNLEEPYTIGETEISSKDEAFSFFSFQMDFSKAHATIPGTYSCEITLDGELIENREFQISPTFEIVLGKVENNQVPRPQTTFAEGVSLITGLLKTNYVFPAKTTVSMFWFATRAMGIQANQIIFKWKKCMEKEFKDLYVACKPPTMRGGLPYGNYLLVIGINSALVAAKEFIVDPPQRFLQAYLGGLGQRIPQAVQQRNTQMGMIPQVRPTVTTSSDSGIPQNLIPSSIPSNVHTQPAPFNFGTEDFSSQFGKDKFSDL